MQCNQRAGSFGGRRMWGSVSLAAGAVISLIISGCTVGPDYHAPKVEMPRHYRPATTQATTQPTIAQWWRTFDDPRLDALILDASQNAPDLQAAEARIREAREARIIAGTGYWPTVAANGKYTRSNNFGGGGGSTGTTSSGGSGGATRNLYQAGFDATWELDVFGGTRRAVEAATAQEEAATADYQNVLVTLYGEIAVNYIQLRGYQREIMIAEDNAQAQRETLKLTQAKRHVGLTSDLDVVRAEAQVASTLSTIPTFQTQAAAAAHRLAVLTGKEPGALLDELANPQPIPDPPPQVPVGIPSQLLRRRPDVRTAERNLAAANANIGVYVADLFPKFSLTGDAGYQSGDYRSLLNSSNLFWGFGPSVSWDVFTAGRTRANIRAQQARTDEALANYKSTVLTALEDVENALVAYQNDQARTEALVASVRANQRAVSLSQQLYQQGLSDFLSVLQAQLNLFVVQDQLVQSYVNVSTDVVQLYKALGGGWEEQPQGATVPFPAPTTRPVPWITEKLDLTGLGPTTQPLEVIQPAPRPTVTPQPATRPYLLPEPPTVPATQE